MDVVENRNISVSSVWKWCEGNVCVSGLGVVQKRHVYLRSGRGARGMSLSAVWRGAEEECLYTFFLDILRQEYLCLRPGHRVRLRGLCLMSERSAEKDCLYVSV